VVAFRRALRLVSRLGAALFLAWFMAVSVLATVSSAAIARLIDAAETNVVAVSAGGDLSRDVEADAAADSAEETPSDDGSVSVMAPPGDDVPPEVEVDIEEPFCLVGTLVIPRSNAALVALLAPDDSHAAHVPESASPPPRA
jgi:hypothetical protein